jgi:hypothetical protein
MHVGFWTHIGVYICYAVLIRHFCIAIQDAESTSNDGGRIGCSEGRRKENTYSPFRVTAVTWIALLSNLGNIILI